MKRKMTLRRSSSLLPPTYLEDAVALESCATLPSYTSADDAPTRGEGTSRNEYTEVRRQVHAESMMYRHTSLYLSKAVPEEPTDEHTVLKEQLRALECAERNGALLKPDEAMFPERAYYYNVEPTRPLESGAGILQRKQVSKGLSTTVVHVVSSTITGGGLPTEVRSAASGTLLRQSPTAQPTPIFAAIASAVTGLQGPPQSTATISRRLRLAERARGIELSLPTLPATAFAAPASEVKAVQAASGALTGAPRGLRSPASSLRRRFLSLLTLQKYAESPRADVTLARDRVSQLPLAQEAREAALQRVEPAAAPGRVRQTISAQVPSTKLYPPEYAPRIADYRAMGVGRKLSVGLQINLPHDREVQPFVPTFISARTAATAEELEIRWREAPPAGESAATGARFRLTTDEGGELHILNWQAWLQRQRERGLYFSENLYLLTVFGAVTGSRCLASLWLQLHTWESAYFFLAYLVVFLAAGLPLIHTEMLLGNLYRGSVVKCFTQINPHFAGLGLAIAFANFLRLAVRSVYASQLLLYFIASWQFPMPWEAAYYYLFFHEPRLLGNVDSPSYLNLHHSIAVGLVWLLVLAHTCRGLFRLGFTSALLMFLGFLLSATLLGVCLMARPSTGILSTTVRIAGEYRGAFKPEKLCSILSWSFTNILADLYIGCGVYQALSSYTKVLRMSEGPQEASNYPNLLSGIYFVRIVFFFLFFNIEGLAVKLMMVRQPENLLTAAASPPICIRIGYNVVPGGNYTALIQLCLAASALVAILGVLGSVEVDTGISVKDLVAKTRNVPAHFAIYPSGFVNISAANVFSMFLYGGAFLLDTQTVAILFHTFLAVFQESRVASTRWRGALAVGLSLMVFVFTVLVCLDAQVTANTSLSIISSNIVLPLVVLFECLVVGWYLNYRVQFRVAGRKATAWYAGLCGLCSIAFCASGLGRNEYVCWAVPAVFLINALLALVVAFIFKPHRVSAHSFRARFYSLYLGNLDRFVKEVQRTTLCRSRFSWNFVEWIASLFRGIFWCRPFTPPSLFWRISLVWACCIKHLVPVLAAQAVVHGLSGLSVAWRTSEVRSAAQAIGITVVSVGAFLTIVFPFIPKVGRWICPPAEDYMPVRVFPSHPPVRREVEPLTRRLRRILLEFLWADEKQSPFVTNFIQNIQKEESAFQWVPPGSHRFAPGETASVLSLPNSAIPASRRRGSFETIDRAQAAAAARRRHLSGTSLGDASDEGGVRRLQSALSEEEHEEEETEGAVGGGPEEVSADVTVSALGGEQAAAAGGTAGELTAIASKESRVRPQRPQ